MNKITFIRFISILVLIITFFVLVLMDFSKDRVRADDYFFTDNLLGEELEELEELEEQEDEEFVEESGVIEELSEIPNAEEQENDKLLDEKRVEFSVDSIAEVTTFNQFRLAIANPMISKIEIRNNITRSGTGIATAVGTLTRDVVINGNGFAINFGANNGSLFLGAVPAGETRTLRVTNASLAKTGQTAIFAVNNSINSWTLELENITELASNGARMALIPQGKVAFIGGVNRFERSAIHTLFDVRDVEIFGQSEVIVNRGNAVIITSAASIPNPSLMVREGSTLNITTTAGTAANDTVALRGINPKINVIEESTLNIRTAGTTAQATNVTNNALALPGNNASIEVSGNSVFRVNSIVGNTNPKRGIHLAGDSPQMKIEDSLLDVRTAGGTGINLVGNNVQLSFDNANIDVNATTGRGISLEGIDPEFQISNGSQVNLVNTANTNAVLTIANGGNLGVSTNASLTIQGAAASGVSLVGVNSKFLISSQGNVDVRNTSSTALLAPVAFTASDSMLSIDDAQMTIEKNSGTTPALRMTALANHIQIRNSGELAITNRGNGIANNGNTANGNQGIQFMNGSSNNTEVNEIFIADMDSKLIIDAASGPAIDATSNSMNLIVKNQGIFRANGRTASMLGATIASNSVNLDVEFNNPTEVDIRNNHPEGGNIINASSTSNFISANSNLALWLNDSNFEETPNRDWDFLRYSLIGEDFATIASTSLPLLFSTKENSFGSNGFSIYSRLNSKGDPILGAVDPVDPLEPEIDDIILQDPPDLIENQGLISIDFVSQFNFGIKNISTEKQIYYANPQRLLNTDGTVNEIEERPNFIQISDRRPTFRRSGWELSVRQENQFETANGKRLLGAQFQIENAELITSELSIEPGFFRESKIIIPGERNQLIIAEDTEGQGTWIYRFGDEITGGESILLEVPRGANPEATTYSTILNWELSVVPSN